MQFVPHPLLRNPHVQSILATTKPRRWRAALTGNPLGAVSEPVILDCGDGVRLQCWYAPQRAPGAARATKGLVVLLHGWEGSADSTYILSTGGHLYRRGYEIVRLNFRDHGDTHHLNQELFHSCRIAEAVGAVQAIAQHYRARPLFLLGFSLGGNFALRVGVRAPAAGVDLAGILAVSPVVDPVHGLDVLDNGPFVYRHHFLKKWRNSMRRKQQHFPQLYDFSEAMTLKSIGAMTRYFVERYTPFPTMHAYLRGYAVTGDALASLSVPTTVITAQDDPIIPVEDFARIARPKALHLTITPHGGHCGFIENLALNSWVERQTPEILERLAA